MSTKQLDWLAVEMVCSGKRMKLTQWQERYAVVRALDHRMLVPEDDTMNVPPGVLSASNVADLMQTTARSVARLRASLPPATKMRCPDCREPMWLRDDGTVEPHPNRWNDTCGFQYDTAALAS